MWEKRKHSYHFIIIANKLPTLMFKKEILCYLNASILNFISKAIAGNVANVVRNITLEQEGS